jgi:hypothetical protein
LFETFKSNCQCLAVFVAVRHDIEDRVNQALNDASDVASLPLAAVLAEDAAKTETTDQKQEQSSETTGMKGMMGKGQMMSNLT